MIIVITDKYYLNTINFYLFSSENENIFDVKINEGKGVRNSILVARGVGNVQNYFFLLFKYFRWIKMEMEQYL